MDWKTSLPQTPAPILEHAAARERVVDEHMFSLDHPDGRRRATFRLQLFQAAGHQPVAVATQQVGEGSSLVNAAEACVTAIWRTFLADEPKPPIWIQRLLSGDDMDHFSLVTFDLDDTQRLSSPQWRALRDADVDLLVGQRVDRDRGAGFEPWPEERLPAQDRFAPAWVALFPNPRPFREPCMATIMPWWRRLVRQIAPRRGGRDCCWYHGGDWHRVSAVAVRLVRDAQAADVDHDDIPSHVSQLATGLPLSHWEREALYTLLCDTVRPYGPLRYRSLGYNNGQHRAQAMIDAGVRRTLVERGSY
jgi:hypothetical protein